MEQKKGLGIATLVIAIIGLLGCWIPFLNIVSITLFIVAIIMGIIAAVKNNGRVMAIIGIVLALIGWFVGAKINGAVVDGVADALKDFSGDIVITQSGEVKSSSDWLSGFISEGIDEMNNQIEAGVTEFSDTVTDINDQVVEGVEEGVENVNEGLENLGEDVAEVVTGEEVE